MTKSLNVVFLLDNYYPKFSPVAKCAYNIADELSTGFNVLIITLDGVDKTNQVECLGSQKVVRGYIEDFEIRRKSESSWNRKNVILKVKLIFIRTKRYLSAIFSRINLQKDIVTCYLDAMNKMNIDVIIPVCLPFESVAAAVIYKKSNPKTIMIPFLFDRFTYNRSLHRNNLNRLIKQKAHKSLEHEMYLYSDHIFAMHQLKQNFMQIFSENLEKFSFVEHPLLKCMSLPNRDSMDNKIRLLYAGALYKKYRTPEYLLKVFGMLKGEFVLDFYSTGNCEGLINRYIKGANNQVNRRGYVSIKELEQAYANADILISIGNFKSQNLASKTFEYMSTGKPIVHFYENEKDPVLDLLNKYPMALTIRQDAKCIKENALRFKDFCNKHKNYVINFEEVTAKYKDATPAEVAKYFEEKINIANQN